MELLEYVAKMVRQEKPGMDLHSFLTTYDDFFVVRCFRQLANTHVHTSEHTDEVIHLHSIQHHTILYLIMLYVGLRVRFDRENHRYGTQNRNDGD